MVFIPYAVSLIAYLLCTIAWAQHPAPIKETPPQTIATSTTTPSTKIVYSALPSWADRLGWIDAPFNGGLCRGYYQEPPLGFVGETHHDPLKSVTKISADTIELHHAGTSALSGHVSLNQPFRQLRANKAYLNRDLATHKPTTVDLQGNIQLREPGKLILANSGHINLVDDSGEFNDLLFRFSYTNAKEPIEEAYRLGMPIPLYQTHGWGNASYIKREPSGILRLLHGTYSTCPPNHAHWQIKAQQIVVDKEKGRGLAKNARLYFFGVPLLYTPLFTFPLDNHRKTGILFPSPGYTNNSGSQVSFPFYWNMAPNYDFLFTPTSMSKRGIQWNGDFRYLTPHRFGSFHGSLLPNDRNFIQDRAEKTLEAPPDTPGINRLDNASSTRHFISWRDDANYNAHWNSHLFINLVGDDYYFEDFTKEHGQITRNQLINEASLHYTSTHWDGLLHVQEFQTLHPINQAPVDNQYRRLPQLALTGYFPGLTEHINLQWRNEIVYFDKDKNPSDTIFPVTGGRFYTAPHLQFPFHGYNGFFIPEVELGFTQYSLYHQLPNENSDISRFLPLMDIDAGLYFSRPIYWFGHPFTQTLEPRLFYLYVPNHNQDDIPLFDTDLQPFTYEQFFRHNRFTSIDRIGDANQLSTTISSAFLDHHTGEEQLRASLGAIVYFHHREVTINNSRTSFVALQNSVSPNALISPVVGQMDYHLYHHWYFNGSTAWDPYFTHINNSNINFQYKIDNGHIINIGYAFLRGGDTLPERQEESNGRITLTDRELRKNNLNQMDFSIAWPLSLHWQGYSHWSYNFSHGHPLTYFAGLAYNSCCWGLRLVGGREFNYLDSNNHAQYNNLFYIELSLRGLGNFGPNKPGGLLQRDIPGYKNSFGQLLP